MKTLILLILLLIPQQVGNLTAGDDVMRDRYNVIESSSSYNINECTRWCWEPPSLMLDWSVVADEIASRNQSFLLDNGYQRK